MTKTVLEIRKDFPYLNEEKVGKKVIYLDNAATSQKPQAVIDTITNYCLLYTSNMILFIV